MEATYVNQPQPLQCVMIINIFIVDHPRAVLFLHLSITSADLFLTGCQSYININYTSAVLFLTRYRSWTCCWSPCGRDHDTRRRWTLQGSRNRIIQTLLFVWLERNLAVAMLHRVMYMTVFRNRLCALGMDLHGPLNPLWLIWTKRIRIKFSTFFLKSSYVKCGLKYYLFLSPAKILKNKKIDLLVNF